MCSDADKPIPPGVLMPAFVFRVYDDNYADKILVTIMRRSTVLVCTVAVKRHTINMSSVAAAVLVRRDAAQLAGWIADQRAVRCVYNR